MAATPWRWLFALGLWSAVGLFVHAAAPTLNGVKLGGVPLGYWLGVELGWGAPGMWWGLILGLAAAAALLALRFYRLSRHDDRLMAAVARSATL